ncbi:HlyD family type I secretion periplasmic adaptor subunit [Bradyrhizobium mercantei]|uniref:HlyD family type I secretion periplasmic adaptor subunit n=1 Tax=Bradyrhizobium mercantei TaxID=1904807 RepID=UPI000976551E|nr:HlyD family type I secretion periplasmic adaptor subunit [Bradyrhizobium mercantei]
MVQPMPLRPNDSNDNNAPPNPEAPRPAPLRLVPAAPRLTAVEREFLPATIELIETPLSPTLRITASALCGLLAAALIWAGLARIDMVAVADGKVVPLGQVKVVQPLETAMIRGIHVDEGDHVTAGQLLVDLDPTEVRADLAALTYNRTQAELDAEVARALLSRDPERPFRGPEGAAPAQVEQSRSQARREIEKHRAMVAGLTAEMAQKDASLQSNDAQIERAKLILPLLEEKNKTAKALYEKGNGTRPPVLDSEQQIVEKNADLKIAERNIDQIRAERSSIQAKLAESEAGYMADSTDRLTKALTKISQLDQDITKTRQKESYRRLVAPVDGTVQGLKIHTSGAVVTTADTLMTIVPDGAGIEVDCMVPNKDIGFVSEGQAVEVKLEAFPFSRYGLVPGRVRKLGRDAATASNAGHGPAAAQNAMSGIAGAPPAELAYPARVTLLQDWILVDGRREPIRSGMRVSAEIKTGDRRVIEYLLSPVLQAVKEAGRER